MALARQLDAQVEIAKAEPGTEVRIVHLASPAAASEQVVAVLAFYIGAICRGRRRQAPESAPTFPRSIFRGVRTQGRPVR